jgi:hypothetical protein
VHGAELRGIGMNERCVRGSMCKHTDLRDSAAVRANRKVHASIDQRLVSTGRNVTDRRRVKTAAKEWVEELRRVRIGLRSVQVVLRYAIHLRLRTWNTE